MMAVFKTIQLFVIVICLLGSIGNKDDRLSDICQELFKVSCIMFLAAEVLPKIIETIG